MVKAVILKKMKCFLDKNERDDIYGAPALRNRTNYISEYGEWIHMWDMSCPWKDSVKRVPDMAENFLLRSFYSKVHTCDFGAEDGKCVNNVLLMADDLTEGLFYAEFNMDEIRRYRE